MHCNLRPPEPRQPKTKTPRFQDQDRDQDSSLENSKSAKFEHNQTIHSRVIAISVFDLMTLNMF